MNKMAPKVSIGQRWQIIGMHRTGMSCRAIGRQLNLSHTTISRLIAKHVATGDVKDRSKSGRPPKTSAREDRVLVRMAWRNPFLNSVQLRNLWRPYQRLSTGTVRRRLHAAGLRARRPVRRPLLTPRHKQDRLNWCTARQGWNIRSWRRIHWSDESRFLLHVTDGRAKVWRSRGAAYDQRNIQEEVPFGGGSVMVWGCCSFDCKLDLVIIPGNLNGQRYQNEILNGHVVPHFDNHNLASRPVFMDDNARPHRAHAVRQFLRNNAIDTIPWPARSPDLNPLEHLWDILGRQVKQRDPPVNSLQELSQALIEEWNRIPLRRIRRLIESMRRRVRVTIAARGGYTRY